VWGEALQSFNLHRDYLRDKPDDPIRIDHFMAAK
jgi:hypothetical protein